VNRQRDAAKKSLGRGVSRTLRSVTIDGHSYEPVDQVRARPRHQTRRVARNRAADPRRDDPAAPHSPLHLYTHAWVTDSIPADGYRGEARASDWRSCLPGVDGEWTLERTKPLAG
jgi:hypothetical protein